VNVERNDLVEPLTDSALLARWHRERNEIAFAELLSRHAGLVTAISKRRLAEPDSAGDITGQAFALLAQRASKVPNGQVVGWLIQATIHLSNSENRATKRRKTREQTAYSQSVTPKPMPTNDLSAQIDAQLLKLNPAERECILLHAGEELSHREVGQRLGISEDAARVKFSRAIERLRRRLGVSPAAIISALPQWRPLPLSTDETARLTKLALTPQGVIPTAGSLALRWFLMNTTQRISIAVVVALLLVGGTTLTVQATRPTPPTSASLTKSTFQPFIGNWQGQLSYTVRRTGRKVTMPATSVISMAAGELRVQVKYTTESNWGVDARVTVSGDGQQLVYLDKGDRQQFKILSRESGSVTGERFVDEPGRPRQERVSFRQSENQMILLTEEKLSAGGWKFANEYRMERAK